MLVPKGKLLIKQKTEIHIQEKHHRKIQFYTANHSTTHTARQ